MENAEKKVILIREMTPEMVAAVERAKEWFDVKTTTKAVEAILTRFWPLTEKHVQLDRKHNFLVEKLEMVRDADEALSKAKMNHTIQLSELLHLLK